MIIDLHSFDESMTCSQCTKINVFSSIVFWNISCNYTLNIMYAELVHIHLKVYWTCLLIKWNSAKICGQQSLVILFWLKLVMAATCNICVFEINWKIFLGTDNNWIKVVCGTQILSYIYLTSIKL